MTFDIIHIIYLIGQNIEKNPWKGSSRSSRRRRRSASIFIIWISNIIITYLVIFETQLGSGLFYLKVDLIHKYLNRVKCEITTQSRTCLSKNCQCTSAIKVAWISVICSATKEIILLSRDRAFTQFQSLPKMGIFDPETRSIAVLEVVKLLLRLWFRL